MRAFVFTDRALERQAGRFVWLSINAEKEANAPFLEKFPVSGFPTLLVVDPTKEEAAFRWLGGASVAQFEKLLDDGERALAANVEGPGAALADADRLMGAGKNREAATAYQKALVEASSDWPSRDRVVDSLLTTLSMTGQNEECVRTAHSELPHEKSAHFANVVASGLSCALSLEGEGKQAAVAEFEPAVGEAASDHSIEMAVDDRSALYDLLVDARREAKDDEAAKRVATEWLAFLDAEAARAGSAEARAVFDPHRLSAAIAAGVPDRAVAFLSQSMQDLPTDYNPPARLAIAYRELGRYDEALTAVDRALELVYGPRKLRVYATRADILDKKGDREGARRSLEDALRYAEKLPRAQVSQAVMEGLRKEIAKRAGSPS